MAGDKIISYKEYYEHISLCLQKTRVFVPVSFKVIKPLVNIAEKTPLSPLTSEQLLLFQQDNVALNIDKSFKDLNINPQDIMQITRNIVEN